MDEPFDPKTSEEFIRRTVASFEVALRMMRRDDSTVHAFDLGEGVTPATGKREPWSLLIVIAPRAVIDAELLQSFGAVAPCEPIGEPEPIGKREPRPYRFKCPECDDFYTDEREMYLRHLEKAHARPRPQ